MSRPYTAVLFDLDGTIVDSAPGITASLAAMFAQMGLPIPTPAELLAYVGPPLMDSFRELAGFDEATAARALSVYRPIYHDRGVYDARVYPGLDRTVWEIHDSDLVLSLATSKPETPARMVLKHFGLLPAFDELAGASDDEVRSKKADVVAEALRRLSADGADLSRPVMVGDRSIDVQGAAEHGIPTIFVSWGYGPPEEQAGALAVVDNADELLDALGIAHRAA
ncbi:MAG: HAD hydrolase-like protein [Microbacteriaceae bacterium]|nr:HAD hydrolase-like protein [Microbacteriaceae bacterium]